MKSHQLNIYLNTLGRNPEYAALFNRANQLNQIEHVLAASTVVPERLLAHYKIGPLYQNQLTLLAENASVAAKLKNITPSILKTLHKKGWKITSINVRVQNLDYTDWAKVFSTNKPVMEKSGISSAGIESLNHLARTLPDSQLKVSVQRLLKNQS